MLSGTFSHLPLPSLSPCLEGALYCLPRPDDASDNRNDLAKTLYSLLFDQFCINFANERLQSFIQKHIFESHVDKYQTEEISRFVPLVPYFDNAECVRLLQNRPGGLIHIVDDQARRSHKKTDHTMVEAFGKCWGYLTFTINHFNSPVTYSSEGFLDRNLDSLNPDFVSLLCGSNVGAADSAEGVGSVNPFVKGLFSGKAIATQAHPKNEDTIVSAQQPVRPMCAPSTCRKGTVKQMPTLREDGATEEQDRKEEDALNPSLGQTPAGSRTIQGLPKRNRLRDVEAEAGIDVRSIGDPYAPYASPGLPPDNYTDPFNQASSQAHVPLVAATSPFQHRYLYDNECEDRKLFCSDDFDNRSRLTSSREETNYAWREKLTLNNIIWFIYGCAVFVIATLGLVSCPTEHVFSTSELASHSYTNSPNNVYTAIRGEVFDLTQVAATHQRVVTVIPTKTVLQYGGEDATCSLFSALCNGVSGSVSPWVQLSLANMTDPNAQYHDFRAITNDSRPDWYFESMTIMRWNNRVGYMGYTPQEISSMANSGYSLGIYDRLIYDMTNYVNSVPAVKGPNREVQLWQDLTKAIDNLNIDSGTLAAQKMCLRNLFLIGTVDNRNSPQCLFSQYILLVLSVMMVSIITLKFIASINFGSPRAPKDPHKFVICQVPCYMEEETSLRCTIDSLARLRYDDKHKLILVVCDGNIVGSGNH
ncbi:hypothetical protein J3R83DRAFT_8354 [Lanmaoa asiatica]|nr:hypothetical protein J3R83DRAFT_8354 [Lanmaoa asiatica]